MTIFVFLKHLHYFIQIYISEKRGILCLKFLYLLYKFFLPIVKQFSCNFFCLSIFLALGFELPYFRLIIISVLMFNCLNFFLNLRFLLFLLLHLFKFFLFSVDVFILVKSLLGNFLASGRELIVDIID